MSENYLEDTKLISFAHITDNKIVYFFQEKHFSLIFIHSKKYCENFNAICIKPLSIQILLEKMEIQLIYNIGTLKCFKINKNKKMKSHVVQNSCHFFLFTLKIVFGRILVITK